MLNHHGRVRSAAMHEVLSRLMWSAAMLLGATLLQYSSRVMADVQPNGGADYIAVDLGVYPGDTQSYAYGLNNRGQIVGRSANEDYGSARAVIWQYGNIHDLGTLRAPYDMQAEAIAINDRGHVVGNSYAPADKDGNSSGHAFLYMHGRKLDLGTLGGPQSGVAAINNCDQIVGWSETPDTYTVSHGGETRTLHVRHAFLWERGVMHDLGTLGCWGECPQNEYSYAVDINDAGEVVGATSNAVTHVQSGFLWRDGSMRPLYGTETAHQIEVYANTRRGTVLGIDDTAGYTGQLWDGRARLMTFPCSAQGFTEGLGFAVDINDRNVILGRNNHSPYSAYYGPTLCNKGSVSYLPPVGPVSGDNMPTHINNKGWVVGDANLLTPDGQRYMATHAVLWRPQHVKHGLY